MIKNRQVGWVLVFACLVPSTVFAQSGMSLLSVESSAEKGEEVEAAAAPSAAEALAATERILTIWPQLVGKFPAGEPRYNAEDIGHIARSSGIGALGKPVMERKMASGLKECGVDVPEDALKHVSGQTRLADRDDNGGERRTIDRAKLEALKEDGDLVKAYFAAFEKGTGVKMTGNKNGMSVKDWERVRSLLKGARMLGW